MGFEVPHRTESREESSHVRRGTGTICLIVAAHLLAPWALFGAAIVGREPEPGLQPLFVRAVTATSWALIYSQISLLALWLVLGQCRWRLLVAPISLFFLDIETIVRIWWERESKFTFWRYDPRTLWSELSSNFWSFATEGITWAAPLFVVYMLGRVTGRRIAVARGLDAEPRPFQIRVFKLFGITTAVATAIPIFKLLRPALLFSFMEIISATLYPCLLAIAMLVAALGRQRLWWRGGLAIAALVWMPLMAMLLGWWGDKDYFSMCVIAAAIHITTLSFFRHIGYRLCSPPIRPLLS